MLDTVPSAAFAPQNKPIGYYQREYGFDPTTVSTEGNAFAQGMADAGIAATVKHFPGLGRVTANTDTTTGVTDTQTTRYDAYVQPYADAVNQGVPIVMVSLAYYSKIDAEQPGRVLLHRHQRHDPRRPRLRRRGDERQPRCQPGDRPGRRPTGRSTSSPPAATWR